MINPVATDGKKKFIPFFPHYFNDSTFAQGVSEHPDDSDGFPHQQSQVLIGKGRGQFFREEPQEIFTVFQFYTVNNLQEFSVLAACSFSAPTPLTVLAPDFFFFGEEDLDHEVFLDRKSTRLNSSHVRISYAVF